MKKEIEFKAKRVDNDKWVFGDLCRQDDRFFINDSSILDAISWDTVYEFENYEVDPNTVCQLTPLPEKNDENIFEGDEIIKYYSKCDGSDGEVKAIVVFHGLTLKGRVVESEIFKRDSLLYLGLEDSLELTGKNIHD